MSSDVNIGRIKARLLERKRQLEEQLKNLYTEKVTDDQVQDVGDQALSSTMESLRNSLQETEREEYMRITRALQMIDDGTYGICIDCGQQISEKRLNSFPNASRCLVCQEIFEEGKTDGV